MISLQSPSLSEMFRSFWCRDLAHLSLNSCLMFDFFNSSANSVMFIFQSLLDIQKYNIFCVLILYLTALLNLHTLLLVDYLGFSMCIITPMNKVGLFLPEPSFLQSPTIPWVSTKGSPGTPLSTFWEELGSMGKGGGCLLHLLLT